MGFCDTHLIPLVDEGLGNSAYLVDLGDGRALAVDASRDLRALRRAAERRALTVAFAADTHLHADFLSGAVQLHHDTGATILASAAGRRTFDHVGLHDGEQIDLGGLRVEAMATPGHTDEHIALLLTDGDRPIGVFSGGSLIVGSAARTDLLGPQRTVELAHAQYQSLHRLASLPDDVAVWPTHGAGSFCSAPPGAERVSTVGAQKRDNPLLAAPDKAAFTAMLLESVGSYPSYFARLPQRNQQGPQLLPETPELAALDVARVKHLVAQGAVVVDVRPAAAFAEGHVPGSLSIPLRDQFATWLGWLLDDTTGLVFVVDAAQDTSEILWQAYKIGYERLLGRLDGGVPAWHAAGEALQSLQFATADRLPDRRYLDVRQQSEYAAGHVGGALHIELGELAGYDGEVPASIVVGCGHGERAMTAASVLQRAGNTDVAVLDGGPQDYATAHRRSMCTGIGQ